MSEYILTASRFDQVVEWYDNGAPKRVIKHQHGGIVTDLSDSEVDRLVRAGAIKPAIVDPTAQTVIWVDEVEDTNVGDSDSGVGDSGAQVPDPEVSAPPKKTATAKEWQEYAVTRGLPRAEAESLSRAELIEKFGH